MKTLRVLSYNIHKGFTLGQRSFVLARIRDAIRLVKADLVFLQEVLGAHSGHSRKVSGWPRSPQFEYLADEIWQHFAYGKNAVYEEGHHGNAILSKYPIVSSETIDVSAHRFEQRGLLHAVIKIPAVKTPLHAVCVHFGLTRSGRDKQCGSLVKRVGATVLEGEPLVIAGDFNDWSERAAHYMEKITGVHEAFHHHRGAHARTYPSRMPILKLDRIYCRGFFVDDVEVLTGSPWSRLSDHAALFAEITMKGH